MHAMVLNKLAAPLEWTELADRKPGQMCIRDRIGGGMRHDAQLRRG